MSNIKWAEREVELACKRENPNRKEGEWDYGCACYESALKAFKSLEEDNHSGFSYNATKQILINLMEGRPLTPIEDTEENWTEMEKTAGDSERIKSYRSTRVHGLYKNVYPDGTVKYKNNNYCICADIHSGITYGFGFVSNIIHEMFPITMPYIPEKPITVYCEDFLTDEGQGEFDTFHIFLANKPNGEAKLIDRYFKEVDYGFEEITADEYKEREKKKIEK